MSIDALTQAWSEALSQNSDQLGPAAMSFLRSAKPLGDIDGTILVAVPNDFAKSGLKTTVQMTSRRHLLQFLVEVFDWL